MKYYAPNNDKINFKKPESCVKKILCSFKHNITKKYQSLLEVVPIFLLEVFSSLFNVLKRI